MILDKKSPLPKEEIIEHILDAVREYLIEVFDDTQYEKIESNKTKLSWVIDIEQISTVIGQACRDWLPFIDPNDL